MLEQFSRSRALLLALAKDQFAGVSAFQASADGAAGYLVDNAVSSKDALAASLDEQKAENRNTLGGLAAVDEPSVPLLLLIGVIALSQLRRSRGLTSH